ncbi:hypothetical protein GIB67_001444, partial [Kingdonia uniflora]
MTKLDLDNLILSKYIIHNRARDRDEARKDWIWERSGDDWSVIWRHDLKIKSLRSMLDSLVVTLSPSLFYFREGKR